jgi:hypothetical protein
MVKLILEVNVKAGSEAPVLAKLNEVFNKPFMSQIEQLSDFYLVLDLTAENVEKVATLHDEKGILSMKLTPAQIGAFSTEKAKEGEEYFVVFVSTEVGQRGAVMEQLKSENKLYHVRNAGYIFDDRADIIVELTSAEAPVEINRAIREIEGVEDTIFYNLPRTADK